MKANIHPQYYSDTQVVCTACGNTFTSGSTKQQITVEVCYKCHPFYTGEQRLLDTRGKVESFQRRQQQAKDYQATVKSKKKDKKNSSENAPKSLRELLGQM